MTPAQRSAPFGIQLLNSLSHLADKTAPYSISDWYHYGQVDTYCGGQVWMTTNLNVGTFIPSKKPDGSVNRATDNGIVEKYCMNDIEANCVTYGAVYNWGEICNYSLSEKMQGICPAGYHIPGADEWNQYKYCVEHYIEPTGPTTLAQFQSGQGGSNNTSGPGYKLRSTTGWSTANGFNHNGSDAIGFHAMPADYLGMNQAFAFWSPELVYSFYFTSTYAMSGMYITIETFFMDLSGGGPYWFVPTNYDYIDPSGVSMSAYALRCIKN
jgi:uncharacterized protein (TIGR02145 family)